MEKWQSHNKIITNFVFLGIIYGHLFKCNDIDSKSIKEKIVEYKRASQCQLNPEEIKQIFNFIFVTYKYTVCKTIINKELITKFL